MLIYPKNADLGKTEGKPSAYFIQETQAENPGSRTELGLGSQTRQSKRRQSPGKAGQPELFSVTVSVWKKEWKKYKSMSQMFLEERALFVFVQSPFFPGLWYEHIWKGLSWGRGAAPDSQSLPFPSSLRLFLLGPSSSASLILYEFFPRRLFTSCSNESPGSPTYQAARHS